MASCYIRTDSISRDESCIRRAVQSLQRDPHEARASAEEAGKASADGVGRAHEVEQDLTLFACEEERPADRGIRGPFALRYDATPTFANGTSLSETISSHDLNVLNQPTEPFSSALPAACWTERSRSS